MTGGAVYTGMLPGRPRDRLGLGVAGGLRDALALALRFEIAF